MKFLLEIELGNDLMQSFYDVVRAMEDATPPLTDCSAPMRPGERGAVRDGNGNTVGKWEITEKDLCAEVMELLRHAEYADGVATVPTQDCEALESIVGEVSR